MALRGNYTVEAAVIVPLYLFVLVLAIRISIYLYCEIREDAKAAEREEIWLVDEFYKYQIGNCETSLQS